MQCIEDQRYLRQAVTSSDGICFIANGSVLPRRSGYDDAPMDESRGMVPFESPLSLRREFVLPHRGAIAGMLVPRGITVIVGGGYHGETLHGMDIVYLAVSVVLQRLGTVVPKCRVLIKFLVWGRISRPFQRG